MALNHAIYIRNAPLSRLLYHTLHSILKQIINYKIHSRILMAESTIENPKTNPVALQHATAVLPPLPAGAPTSAQSRYRLHCEAQMWRYLMDIGMALHKQCHPRPAGPDFRQKIPSTISTSKGDIELVFYTPKGYPKPGTKSGKYGKHDKHDGSNGEGKAYPVILSFHGGGFTIGRATDDVRWARAVNEQVDAVVVSVDYRLAPEYPFPTGVEDGADAVLYVMNHAEELHLDARKIAISGFSAGGNMAFTVPIRVQEELRKRKENLEKSANDTDVKADSPAVRLPRNEGRISCICAWYPSLDFTRTRAERRKTNTRPEKDLPKFFTDLFDASYLYPSSMFSLDSPYLSPGVAPSSLLASALPNDILMYTCEWDELLAEGEKFRQRLDGELGKNLRYTNIKGVVHAFDKGPNPLWRDPKIDIYYKDACAHLRKVFYGSDAPVRGEK